MELIRRIVLAVEDSPTGYAQDDLGIDDRTPEEIAYHAHLMIQAGLATGVETTHMGSSSPSAQITSLTWEGHEFADAARDETRWKKAMGIVQAKGGAVGFDVLKDLLSHFARLSLGLLS
jgi:hypothetical protein